MLKPYVPKQRAKEAAISVDDLGVLDPERAPESVDAQIEAEECTDEAEVSEEAMDEGEAQEAKDEGAMDEESDGDVDSDEREQCVAAALQQLHL